ncbi:MAG: SufD family Fe-S cluster assembly protein [Geoalkalibacter sp.]|jgi:Fe-S cluster assembly scaffold protein SufB|uniref:SufB/SufD family protein n=1 Tax=Geoalkalibacter sp. TaxID=3041440 RepID=UPI003D09CEBD
MSENDVLLEAFGSSGGDRGVFEDPEVAHLLAVEHRILSARQVQGLKVDTEETPHGIVAKISVAEGVRIARPVHLCFGVVHSEGLQQIEMDVVLEPHSSVDFIAHCLFPNAEKVRHEMIARIEIGEGASMCYNETHVHGPQGGVEVVPKSQVQVGEDGRFNSEFNLTVGRVGSLDMDYTVTGYADSVTELIARVSGSGSDLVKIREKVVLEGENSRGLIKSRIALRDHASAEIIGSTSGNAAGARGHVDCMELVRDQAVARAVPIVNVTHPLAKVTHEAAIGTVDQRQLETLLAHGLCPDEAVDVIIRGVLR